MTISTTYALVLAVSAVLDDIDGLPSVLRDPRTQIEPPAVVVYYEGASMLGEFPKEDPHSVVPATAYAVEHSIGVMLLTARRAEADALDTMQAKVMPIAATLQAADSKRRWAWQEISSPEFDPTQVDAARGLLMILTASERGAI